MGSFNFIDEELRNKFNRLWYDKVDRLATFVFGAADGMSKADARANLGPYSDALVTATDSTTARSLANRWADVINIKDFGAKGDGITDDAAAIQAAINAAEAKGGGIVFMPAGVYILTSTLTIDSPGVILEGEGYGDRPTSVGSIELRVSHSSGAGIRLIEPRTVLRAFHLSATSARRDGAEGLNFGIRIEGKDVVGGNSLIQNLLLERVSVTEQPNSGIILIGDISSSALIQVASNNNKKHGFQLDNGSATSRTNKSRPFILKMSMCRAIDNGGHGILAGTEADGAGGPMLRLQLDNFESFRNATDATKRLSAHDSRLFLESSVINESAFGANNVIGGIAVAGRHIGIARCRFIDILNTSEAIRLFNVSGFSTHGVDIRNFRITATSPLNPAIVVDSGVAGIKVNQIDTASITRLITGGVSKTEIRYDGNVATKEIQSPAVATINDDNAASFEFSTVGSSAIALISVGVAEAAIVHLRVGSSIFCTVMTSYGATWTATTGALTGTTGTDTNWTVSVHTDNKFYIENRRGGVRVVSITFLSGAAGALLI